MVALVVRSLSIHTRKQSQHCDNRYIQMQKKAPMKPTMNDTESSTISQKANHNGFLISYPQSVIDCQYLCPTWRLLKYRVGVRLSENSTIVVEGSNLSTYARSLYLSLSFTLFFTLSLTTKGTRERSLGAIGSNSCRQTVVWPDSVVYIFFYIRHILMNCCRQG